MRAASGEDVAALAHHAVAMYADMGVLPPACRDELYDDAARFITAALPRGDYHGWLASPIAQPMTIIAGAALHVRPALPRLRRRGERIEVTTGPQGVVCHVYTDPAWRRRGVGRALLNALLEWTAAEDLPHVFLHASADGRQLYERLGFVPTNEMRYAGIVSPAL